MRKTSQVDNSQRTAQAAKPRIQWELEKDVRLGNQLHGTDYVAFAFNLVCKAGCDPKQLEGRLVGLANYNKRPQKHFSVEKIRTLNGIIKKLSDCAEDLREFVPLMVFSARKEWPIPPLDVPDSLSNLAIGLREASRAEFIKQFKNPSVTQRVSDLVGYVTAMTRKPHYSEMATLIGAALEREGLSEDDVKMMVRRNPRSNR